MTWDLTLLEEYTCEELDKLHQRMGTWQQWCESGMRHVFYSREQMEMDIIFGLIDNKFGLEMTSKKVKIAQGRIDE